MEHQFGPRRREDGLQALLVPDVGDDGQADQGWMALAELEVDLPERILAVVEQRQLRRAQRRHLPRQLGADRAAGTRDHHPAAADQPRHARMVELDLRTVQQILQRHGFNAMPPASRSSVARGAWRTGSACRCASSSR